MADLEVVQGSYGETITLTLQNKQGSAQDVSSYTGEKVATFRAPRNMKIVTSTVDFNSDGTDGKVDLAFTNDSCADIAGEWPFTVELAKTNVVSRSFPGIMKVYESVAA